MISLAAYAVGIVLFSTFFLLAYWYQNWTRKAKMFNKFPGPTHLPIVGGAYHLLGVPFSGR
jgi:hypothetical protein